MKILLFDRAEELLEVIQDPAEAFHLEEINGENSLTVTIPSDLATNVIEGNYIGFFDVDDAFQLFEIREVSDTKSSSGQMKEAYAVHASCELADELVEDARPYNDTAESALDDALSGSRWTTGTVADFGLNSTNYYYESRRSSIEKILETWGGELNYRFILSGNVITYRYVDILSRRGSLTGKRFEYRKDITRIRRHVSLDGLITACYGRGKGEEVGVTEDGKSTYGRRLTFADVVWATPGDPVNKPAAQEWVGDADALAAWGYDGGTRHRYGILLMDEETDDEVLLEKTWAYLQENKEPKIAYEMDVLLLESLTGYEHEKVRLGDTVAVVDKEFNPEIRATARVLKIKRNLVFPEQSEVTLGNYLPSLVGEMQDSVQHITRYRDRQRHYDEGANRATTGLDASGYVDLPIQGGRIVGTPDDGVNVTNTHIGYYNLSQDAWRAYIDSMGRFLFQKDANNYFMYDGDTFEFKGPVVITGGSGWENLTDAPDLGNLAFEDYVTWTLLDSGVTAEIDGKIETWYTATDPNTWAVGDRLKHDGDMWYKTDTKALYRYDGTANTWNRIEDQDALDAYEAASQAQDTADGKRRVFTAEPVPPYDVGDLWAQGPSGYLMVCISPQTVYGSYDPYDWDIAGQGGDENLQNFIDNVYNPDISGLQGEIDGKVETWFYAYEPTLLNLPASGWTDNETKDKHLGDLFFDTSTGFAYRFKVETGTYSWERVQDSGIVDALSAASAAQDTADGKRRVFTSQPTPPYDAGDLWAEGPTGDLMVCISPQGPYGAFDSYDWELASKYTDDSALDTFISVTYTGDISGLQTQIDGKIETYYTATDPNTWEVGDRLKHTGDLWYKTDSKELYRYDGTSNTWSRIEDQDAIDAYEAASAAQDTADGKRRVFTVQPTPPYDVGDLWTEGPTGDLFVCISAQGPYGAFDSYDWDLASKYTDDSSLNTFISVTYATDKSNLQTDIDGKIESWFQSTDPNTWLEVDRPKHNGDLWYKTDTKTLYRYDSTTNTWGQIEDQDALDAYEAASQAQDTADGKRRVFTATPTVPYDVGDLWVEGPTGNIMVCISAQGPYGAYDVYDWDLASKYTDDSTVDTLIGNLGNMAYEDLVESAKLGTTIIEGGYIKSSLLTADNIVTGVIRSEDGNTFFDLDNDMLVQQAVIGGILSKIVLSPSVGLAFYEVDGYDEIFKGGMAVVDGDLTFITDVLKSVDAPYSYAKFGPGSDIVGGYDGFILSLYSQNDQTAPTGSQKIGAISGYYVPDGGAGYDVSILELSSNGKTDADLGDIYLIASQDDWLTNRAILDLMGGGGVYANGDLGAVSDVGAAHVYVNSALYVNLSYYDETSEALTNVTLSDTDLILSVDAGTTEFVMEMTNAALTLDDATGEIMSLTRSGGLTVLGTDFWTGITYYTGSGASAIDPDSTEYPVILTNHANSPYGGNKGFFYVHTTFYSNKSSNRMQMAYNYLANQMLFRRRISGTWSQWELIPNMDYRQTCRWSTDFLMTDLASNVMKNPLVGAITGSGTLTQSTTANHPGYIRMAKGASTGTASLRSNASIDLNEDVVWECCFRPGTLTDSTLYIGMLLSTSELCAGYITGSALYGRIGTGGSSENTSSSYDLSGSTTTWYRLKITVATSKASVLFELFNTSGTRLWYDTCSTGAYIPAVVEMVYVYFSNVTSTTRTVLDVDWISFSDARLMSR